MSDTHKHKQQEEQEEREPEPEPEREGEQIATTSTNPNFQVQLAMHHQDATNQFLAQGSSSLMFPPHHHEPLPWQLPSFNHHHDPFLFPPPLPSFNRRQLQFSGYDVGPSSFSGGAPFGLQMQAELNRMTAQEIMDAKALAASKSHSEAERRRRERINNHLAKLRSLLPSTTKTDKASLLAEVIQHVKELKRQTSVIAESSLVPTESDELTVDPAVEVDYEGRPVVRASLCCDDRADLMPDLIKALKGLRLRTLKAEITTLGGRIKNVLFITGDDDNNNNNNNNSDEVNPPEQQWSVTSIQEALRAVMDKSSATPSGRDDSVSGNAKRQRTNTN